MFKLYIIASVCVAVVLCGVVPDHQAETLRFESDINPDGSYKYEYETNNGIAAQEAGLAADSVNGEFKWESPEGEKIEIQYTADGDGYRATGSAIPVAPEVPPHVVRLLEWIASHPDAIFDDGQYHP